VRAFIMKKAFVLSAVILAAVLLMAAAFSVPASAKVMKFDFIRVSVNVPSGWEVQEDRENNTVGLVAEDESAAITLSAYEDIGMSLKEFAEQAAEELEGETPKKQPNGTYVFDCENENDVTTHVVVSGSEKFAAIISVTGEHEDVDGIIGSIEGTD
jgi:hypothetical protein